MGAMSGWIGLMFWMGLAGAAFAADADYVTTRGFRFIRQDSPVFGTAWQAPDGTVWASRQLPDSYSNDADPAETHFAYHSFAMAACEKVGGQLPSLADYSRLIEYFYPPGLGFTSMTDADYRDLQTMFPDFGGDMATTDIPRLLYGLDTFGDPAPGNTGDLRGSGLVRCLKPSPCVLAGGALFTNYDPAARRNVTFCGCVPLGGDDAFPAPLPFDPAKQKCVTLAESCQLPVSS
jgi:hypothetical protein